MTLSLANCVPLVIYGQSNAVVDWLATDCPANIQATQDVPFCCHLTDPNGYTLEIDTWQSLAPYSPVGYPGGAAVCTWAHELARLLMLRGIRPAIMLCGVGGTALDYWTADPKGTWISARFAQLTTPKRAVGIFYQGESGLGTVSPDWAAGGATVAASLRARTGANTGMVVVQLPPLEPLPFDRVLFGQIVASQAALVQSDPQARLVRDPLAPIGGGVHLALADGLRLAALIANQVQSLVSTIQRNP